MINGGLGDNTTTIIFKNTVPIILNVAPTCSCADQQPRHRAQASELRMLQHKMGKPWPWITQIFMENYGNFKLFSGSVYMENYGL